jgi:hypothetical protein
MKCQIFYGKKNVNYRVQKSPPLVPILDQANPLHAAPSYFPKINFIIILPPSSRSSYWSLSSLLDLPPKSYMHSFRPHACYIPCLSHPPWLAHSNHIWRRVQVMKLLIMQFSPASFYFICLLSKYFPQHRALKYLVCVTPLMSETKFHTHTKLQTKL